MLCRIDTASRSPDYALVEWSITSRPKFAAMLRPPLKMVAARWSTGDCEKMFGWLEIGVKFIKTLASQWDDRSGLNAPSKADNGSVAEGSASGADRSAARSESQM